MYLATLWSALIFQYINSLNIVQFVVRMRSNKNHKMIHSRKSFVGQRVFLSTLGYLKFLLIMDTAFTFRLNLQNFLATLLIQDDFPMSLGTIYSKPMYNFWNSLILVHNNLSLLLGCQLLVFPMGQATGLGTFFHSLRFQNRSFFEVPDSVLKHFKKPKLIS